MSGGGVPKNEAEGVKWLRKAAEQGNADGEFWLGAAYNSGTGVAKDSAEALRWYRMAGDQGNAAAQYNLGQAYNLGNGVEKDITEAARWCRRLPNKASKPLARRTLPRVRGAAVFDAFSDLLGL